ncbi:hypothetical protein O6H91_15G027200 [Diphasiastrum complanatum]|uniref:Uncharacterized protein n=1 Tax=Diphasiastrum complanatum TaxID=34168 RepID=A0ACC2BGN1_DIPCM|nr:hypothetical protein O6H91_15G027200 [Diphasiastrum complanatum]
MKEEITSFMWMISNFVWNFIYQAKMMRPRGCKGSGGACLYKDFRTPSSHATFSSKLYFSSNTIIAVMALYKRVSGCSGSNEGLPELVSGTHSCKAFLETHFCTALLI